MFKPIYLQLYRFSKSVSQSGLLHMIKAGILHEVYCVIVKILHYTVWWLWHWRCFSLVLKELPKASTVWCRGWEELLLIDVSLAYILLSAISSMESRLQPRTEPALLRNLLRLFLSLCLSLLLPHSTHDGIKHCWVHHSIIEGPEKNPAHTKGPQSQAVDSPFLDRASMFWDQSSFLLRWTNRYLNESTVSMSDPWMFNRFGCPAIVYHHLCLVYWF